MPNPYLRPRSTKHRAAWLPAATQPVALTADAAIPTGEDGLYLLSKTGTAGAFSVAAPGQANVGRRLRFTTGSTQAHVVTFTGSTLRDGATGNKITWTAAAFVGCSLEVIAIDATQWSVISRNAGVVA